MHPTLELLLTVIRARPPEVELIEEGEATPQLDEEEGPLAPRSSGATKRRSGLDVDRTRQLPTGR